MTQPYNLRTDRTYVPPRPEILPLPELYSKVFEKSLSTLYPAWSLQYYVCLCSLVVGEPNTLVETGTNNGCSAAFLAQTLRETGLDGHLHTFELIPSRAQRAQRLVNDLGLSDLVTIHVGNSHEMLPQVIALDTPVRFAFIDADHTKEACLGETELLLPNVVLGHGKFYYDNTWCGPVDEAICALKSKYGTAGWVDFPNASRFPNGQAIWQPWQRLEPIPWFDSKYQPDGRIGPP